MIISSPVGDRSGPVPGTRTLLQLSQGMHTAAPAAPLEVERQPSVSTRAGAGEIARQGRRRSSALARAIGTPIRAKPGNFWHASAKSRAALPRDCRQPGASQSSAKNYWQDTPEHAQDHKSSRYGATNQPTALQGEEGTFPGGKVISSLAPALSLTTTGAGWGPTGYWG